MKNSFKAIMLAGVSVAAMIAAGPAMATTPVDSTNAANACNAEQLAGGMQTAYYDAGAPNSTGGKIATAECINTYQLGSGGAVTSTLSTKPVKNPDGTQKTIDGHPIIKQSYNPVGDPVAQVHGTNGTAIGNGASVGSITATCANGATAVIKNGIPSCPTVAAAVTTAAYNSCDTGWTLSGSSCTKTESHSACNNDGGTWAGNGNNGTCTEAATPVPAVYNCTKGSLSGDKCVSQPLVIAHDVKDGTAVGAGASVQHDHSTALGAGAKSTTDHQVVLGTKDDTIAAPGITSQLSKARQTGPLEVVTTDANGNLASDGGRIDATLSDHETRITNTETKNVEQDATLANHETRITSNTTAINQTNNRLNVFIPTGETSTGSLEAWAAGVDRTNANQNIHLSNIDSHLAGIDGQISTLNKNMDKAYSGIAIAMAMESPQVDPGKRFGISVNWGEFEGTSAFAASAKFRFDNTWAGTAGVGTSTNGQVGARAGLQAQW